MELFPKPKVHVNTAQTFDKIDQKLALYAVEVQPAISAGIFILQLIRINFHGANLRIINFKYKKNISPRLDGFGCII